MKNPKIAYVMNIFIVVLEVFGIAWLMSGLSAETTMNETWYGRLKYFTVDSNILMCIAAMIAAVQERQIIKGLRKSVSVFTQALKLMATVSVALTMLVTVFFLAPTMGAFVFYYSSFFLHIVNPLLSIIVFVVFERSSGLSFRYTFAGIVPMVLYSIYYTAEALMHTAGDRIAEGYDWYGFFVAGINSAYIVLPIIIVATYIISLVIWLCNHRREGSATDSLPGQE